MSHRIATLLVRLTLAALVAGCAVPSGNLIDPTEPAAAPAEFTSPPPITAPALTEQPPALPGDAEAAAERALMVIAAGLDLSVETVAIDRIEEVDWPDASLGCPLPGMAYAEVITSGYRAIVTAAGVEYDVHMDTAGTAVVCGPDGVPLPGTIPILPGERIMDGQPWVPVD